MIIRFEEKQGEQNGENVLQQDDPAAAKSRPGRHHFGLRKKKVRISSSTKKAWDILSALSSEAARVADCEECPPRPQNVVLL